MNAVIIDRWAVRLCLLVGVMSFAISLNRVLAGDTPGAVALVWGSQAAFMSAGFAPSGTA